MRNISCIGVYVSLIDKMWSSNISSVIQFRVQSSEYLMMVRVLGPAVIDALKMQR